MKKGEIWLVDLPSSNGSEQSGKRPVVVVAETKTNVVVIIPFTTNVQALRFPYTVEVRPSQKNKLEAISVALVFQIRAIDKIRMSKKIGDIEEAILKEINNTLKSLLDL